MQINYCIVYLSELMLFLIQLLQSIILTLTHMKQQEATQCLFNSLKQQLI